MCNNLLVELVGLENGVCWSFGFVFGCCVWWVGGCRGFGGEGGV